MRIIVANEREKIAMVKLIDALHDVGIDDIENTLQEDFDVDSREISFYTAAFGSCKVVIESSEDEVSIDTELVGICGKCGCGTNGTIDGTEPTLSQLFEVTESDNDWRCEECYGK